MNWNDEDSGSNARVGRAAGRIFAPGNDKRGRSPVAHPAKRRDYLQLADTNFLSMPVVVQVQFSVS